MYYKKDEELEKYLYNKKVALIGPAPYLQNYEIGEFLNKYDVLCRMNEIFPVGQEKKYGSRTDIAFLNCASISVSDYIYKIRESLDISENMKYIICPVIKAQHDWKGDVVENAKMLNICNIPFSWIGKENYTMIHKEIGVEPNTGLMSILILLQYPIKELFITGMTFYSEFVGPVYDRNTYDIYYHREHTPFNLQIGAFNPHLGHSQKEQINYFKNNILKKYFDKIKIDSHFSNILQVSYNNILQLR